jgi:hypothetical protein
VQFTGKWGGGQSNAEAWFENAGRAISVPFGCLRSLLSQRGKNHVATDTGFVGTERGG